MGTEREIPKRKVVLSCALTGVLTDPQQHKVPVTPSEMADHAEQAWNAGAAIVHLHFRDQRPGRGAWPTWQPEVAGEIAAAIRARCPQMLLNFSTGVFGPDISGPLACLEAGRPELAALNAGTLNYLKLRAGGEWAWPPMVFDNPVAKVQQFLDVMQACGTHPEFECFDVGIVRSVGMFIKNGMLKPEMGRAEYNLVMGVASGMPCDADLLALLPQWMAPNSVWQATLIGRAEIWPVHQKTADLGGMLRSGLEDTFYLPNGERASGNGALITELARCAANAGRAIASPQEARALLGLRA